MLAVNPLDTLKKYVDMPSGSFDVEDVAALGDAIKEDFESLGFSVSKVKGKTFAPTLVCKWGTGKKQLMLMGHMDTVFPHAVHKPYHDMGDGKIEGSGCVDMKGGIVVMLYALSEVLRKIDPQQYSICAVINPDEEVGSPDSHETIYNTALESFAALSFEPGREGGGLTCARKGVTSVLISCTGVPGHAGAQYKECSSAIEALCRQIVKLYALRDDEKDISFNAGLISGGTAENVVAPSASCKCEFRYFNQDYQKPLMQKILDIISDEPVKGAHTTAVFGASHPAIDENEKSLALVKTAREIGSSMGLDIVTEKTGGAGDISIAGLAGIGVLDGFGLCGGGMHTVDEYCLKDSMPQRIKLSAEMIGKLCC